MSRSTILLVLATLTVPAGLSAGAGIGMDRDLAEASATFLAAADDHSFGALVAFAGDVDGDGLEDMLVSAYESNGTAGWESGRTYLFLGRASGWSRNLSASDADASFCGEVRGDAAGVSIAGVGDLDGDGFDDFVISGQEPVNPWAGRRGKAYLFYGNSSDWPMDTNLSEAYQSFDGGSVAAVGDVNADGYDDFVIGRWEYSNNAGVTTLYLGNPDRLIGLGWHFEGEGYYDCSGLTVAGAGDVNGDGYDDILVGSDNDVWGVASGKTYLILGRDSGWPRYLRDADASFVGKERDYSGSGLSGAGDVNGDGLDDFLIGAMEYTGQGPRTGTTYLFLGRTGGWATNTSLSSADASFLGEGQYDASGESVAAAGDIDDDGCDDFLIASPYNDESGKNSGQVYLVRGRPTGWAMGTNLSGADASFLGEFVYGRAGISIAGGGDVNGDGTEDILIGAHNGRDAGELGKAYLMLVDLDPPRLTDKTPPTATTGDALTISVGATDTSGVADVTVEWWFGNATARSNASMALASGDATSGTWARDVAVPRSSTDPLHYRVRARDVLGYETETGTANVTVLDDDPPEFGQNLTPAAATTGDPFAFQISVSDNVGVAGVWVEYWFARAYSEWRNFSMAAESVDGRGNGVYAFRDLVVYSSESADLLYFFAAVDGAGNWNVTRSCRIDVIDDDPPVIVEDLSDAVARTGAKFRFALNVSENVGIEHAYVEYWFGEDATDAVNLTMEGVLSLPPHGEVLDRYVKIPANQSGPLRYRFSVRDLAGNWDRSDVRSAEVVDTIPPVADTGGVLTVDQHVPLLLDGSASTDNIGVVSWRWGIADEGGNASLEGRTASYTFHWAGVFSVVLNVSDAAGNRGGAVFNVTVRDTDLPTVDLGPARTVDLLGVLTLDIGDSRDNVGIALVEWTIPPGTGIDAMGGETYRFTALGTFELALTLRDAAGNEATGTLIVSVVDREPPHADAGPDVTVIEGGSVTLDGSASTDNVGVTGCSWWCGEAGLEVIGARITWAPPRNGTFEVTLTASDAAGNDGEDRVTVTVLPREAYVRLGRFRDAAGVAVPGAKVTLWLNGTAYRGTTNDTGWATFRVPRVDLAFNATIVATKPGWSRLEHATPLDGDGLPAWPLPPMEREGAGPSGVASAIIVIVLIIAVAAVAAALWRRRAGEGGKAPPPSP